MRKKSPSIIDKFMLKGLSESDKKEFLHQATTDKQFIKDFVKALELEEMINDQFPSFNEEPDSTKK